MQSGVYEIVNQINGKRYVGSAVNLRKRKNEHFSKMKNGKHPNKRLNNSCKKYGVENFVFKEIVNCSPQSVLIWEQIAIDGLSPEYNICPIAGNTAGRVHSDRTKDKIRKKAIGRKVQPRSQEYRKKISERFKGVPKSPEHNAALQAGRKNRFYTEEQKLKISESLKKSYEDGRRSRKKSEKHCENIGRFWAALTDDQVRDIRFKAKNGASGADLAKEYKKPRSTISQIINLKRYKWVK